MSNTDVSWRWDLVVFRLCNQNPTLSQRQILTSTRFSFSTKMQRLSDVVSNVNLTLHRRLVPAGNRPTGYLVKQKSLLFIFYRIIIFCCIMTHIECISAAAGSRSIFPINFSHMDLIKFYVKALLTTNQTNQLRGESQHHKQIWSRKIYLKKSDKKTNIQDCAPNSFNDGKNCNHFEWQSN